MSQHFPNRKSRTAIQHTKNQRRIFGQEAAEKNIKSVREV